MRLLVKLICCFIPKKRWRRRIRRIRNLLDLEAFTPLHVLRKRYSRKIKKLKNTNDKIKVVFLVSESSKWNGESLYKKFEEYASCFDVLILIFVREEFDYIKPEENLNFFQSRGYKVEVLQNNNLKRHSPDIVFYQQPWGLRTELRPWAVSKYALTVHFPYSIVSTVEFYEIWEGSRLFFRTLWCHFVFSQEAAAQIKLKGVHHNVRIVGHPKLDVYLSPIKTNPWKNKEKYKIIYAPHHSFEPTSLLWGTFKWNGKEILEFAKNNPDTEWIFKPHPRFKFALVQNNIMDKYESESYFAQWADVGNVYSVGDYFDIFRTSDLLITDCGSFLSEYLPTGKPVIHLISSEAVSQSSTGKKHSAHYYKTHNLDELYSNLDMLLLHKKDPLKKKRQADASKIEFGATDKIFNYIGGVIR